MAKLTLIGDAHGKMKKYLQVLHENPGPSVQLGDMGCGFRMIPFLDNKNKFIRGNHDSPQLAHKHPNFLGDFGYLKEYDIFYLGGAFSIDADDRRRYQMETGYQTWWPDEELSPFELNEAMNLYIKKKPRIVISHECPSLAGLMLLQREMKRLYKVPCTESRTAQVMMQMFDAHNPELWVFGHYHFSNNFKLDKTRFLCLNELEAFTLDTDRPLEAWNVTD